MLYNTWFSIIFLSKSCCLFHICLLLNKKTLLELGRSRIGYYKSIKTNTCIIVHDKWNIFVWVLLASSGMSIHGYDFLRKWVSYFALKVIHHSESGEITHTLRYLAIKLKFPLNTSRLFILLKNDAKTNVLFYFVEFRSYTKMFDNIVKNLIWNINEKGFVSRNFFSSKHVS